MKTKHDKICDVMLIQNQEPLSQNLQQRTPRTYIQGRFETDKMAKQKLSKEECWILFHMCLKKHACNLIS